MSYYIVNKEICGLDILELEYMIKRMSEKTCGTCKHYNEHKFRGGARFFSCDGPAADYTDATADDDSNLNTYFKPPKTFGCNGWEKSYLLTH